MNERGIHHTRSMATCQKGKNVAINTDHSTPHLYLLIADDWLILWAYCISNKDLSEFTKTEVVGLQKTEEGDYKNLGTSLFFVWLLLIRCQGGRTRLPKFKFSAKFPIGLHVILQIQIKKFENDCYIMWKIILTENPSRFNVEPLLK